MRTPGWSCLNFLHVFVGYQANFPCFYKFVKKKRQCIESSRIRFNFIKLPVQMHPNFGGNSVPQHFVSFIETPF